jgi:hypothetical protein
VSNTDTATHEGQRITIDITGLEVPTKANRTRRPTEGERRLKKFISLLRDMYLIEGPQGTTTDDGTRFSFTLRQYPLQQRLDEVARLYLQATDRNLQFVYESSTPSKTKKRGRSIDPADVVEGAFGLLKQILGGD